MWYVGPAKFVNEDGVLHRMGLLDQQGLHRLEK